MQKEIIYSVGKHYLNNKFIGWKVWKVHPKCIGRCCPKTVAEFYGPLAKRNAEQYSVYLKHVHTLRGYHG